MKGFADTDIDKEIQFLIGSVETSTCLFYRNGSLHKGPKAADHLRLKLRRGKKYASTSESFIENLASESSWSGKSYHVECAENENIIMKKWLTNRLLEYRDSQLK